MKRFISIIMLLCAFSQISFAELVQEGDPDTSISDNYTFYKLEENGIHYVFAYGPFNDGSGIERSTYQFYAVYHDEDVPAPYRVDIPSEFVWDGVTRKVEGYRSGEYTFNEFKLSKNQLTFNEIYFPKEVYPWRNERGELDHLFVEFSGFITYVNASAFRVSKDNPVFKSVDGVLMTREEDVLLRYPVCSKKINYYIPESVKKMIAGCFYDVSVPVFLNEDCKEYNSYIHAFWEYPFYGLYGRNGVLDNMLYVYSEHIKAWEHSNFDVFPENAVAISFDPDTFIFDDGIFTVWRYFMYNIYNKPVIDGIVRSVEFSYPDDMKFEIVINMDDWVDATFDEEPDLVKIPTYVSAVHKSHVEEMYENRNFPQNAIIEETPNELYLYPELCHGPWVNKQTQFVYGLCRFGDSQLADREWDTDNYEIATIDDTGLLTAYKTGSVNVTLKCTDQRGNIYEASEVINITEEDFIETGIAESDKKQDVYSGGVYNLQGIRVGDNLNGLPKGIYISGGRKVVVQ